MHKFYLKSYKKEFKSFVFENKTPTNYSVIKINPSELYTNSKTIIWEDENKEVVYKGVLYDIVCIKTTGVKVELTVVSDKQEMELKKQFASLYDITSSKTTKEPFNLLKNFFTLKCVISKTTFTIANPETNITTAYISKTSQPSQGFLFQETPPPDFCI